LHPTRSGTAWLFRNLLVADAAAFGRAEREALVDYLWISARATARVMAAALRRFTGVLGQREVLTEAELAAVRQPALVLWGERDRFVPLSHGERAARLLPHASLHIIRGAGHSPNWERAEEVTQRVRAFLTE
ncbi:MAG: alpha/beta fold hydrolase, partial [Longimicrobiales bacterium]